MQQLGADLSSSLFQPLCLNSFPNKFKVYFGTSRESSHGAYNALLCQCTHIWGCGLVFRCCWMKFSPLKHSEEWFLSPVALGLKDLACFRMWRWNVGWKFCVLHACLIAFVVLAPGNENRKSSHNLLNSVQCSVVTREETLQMLHFSIKWILTSAQKYALNFNLPFVGKDR